ncbi:MAG: DUF4433 domain-containing protein, partial [Verrucomicrobiota bacterium]
MVDKLNPDKALIFRIVHVDNLEWILDAGGIDCPNCSHPNPNFVNIGSEELIDKRSRYPVPIEPKGTLSDYVPFYFTPFSMMMYNIHTGFAGITKRKNSEIILFVSSIHKLEELDVNYVFTDQHAYIAGTQFFGTSNDLHAVDWKILQARDFKRSEEDPGKCDRYQAEALVYKHAPLDALLGIGCSSA